MDVSILISECLNPTQRMSQSCLNDQLELTVPTMVLIARTIYGIPMDSTLPEFVVDLGALKQLYCSDTLPLILFLFPLPPSSLRIYFYFVD